MSRPPAEPAAQEEIDLTQSLRQLVLPVGEPDEELADDPQQVGMAVLFSRDNSARKWAPRWLEQAGLGADLREDPAGAIDYLAGARCDVLLVDAGLKGSDGVPLYRELIDASAVTAPVIVLCGSGKDATHAMDAGAWDVVRKPVDWRLAGTRARRALRARQVCNELRQAKDAAIRAVELADSARQRLRSRESFEPVTGLPNKARFMDLVSRGMRAVDRDDNALAVFVIGFNRFRLVIEAMGQERADLVLNEIGYMLGDCLREASPADSPDHSLWTTAAASLDGARFGVMLTCGKRDSGLAEMRQRLQAALARPVQVAGQIVHLSASIGVALYPQDADDAVRLLQRAENAMRDAQSRGGGIRHYCEETDAAAAGKLRLEHMLHEAMDRNEIKVAYQPICRTSDCRLVGAEALLRWPQPDGSFISPNEFAPLAEESGLMVRIGEFVLDRACRQLAEWNRKRRRVEQMCVNVSRVQLTSGQFVETVAQALERHAIDPACLELELSERGVLSSTSDITSHLHALRDLGVRLSIDDFGTGDSAIAYLKELPVDTLKIDRSYISGMLGDDKDAAIVSAMVALGQRLGLAVIAEGVEAPEQLETLRKLDCDLFQGFLVSTPVYAERFEKFLQK